MENLTSDFGGAVAKTLETPELLEGLLSYVPPKDLKNARAVAKLWMDESLDNFRKSLVYVLAPETESERLLKLSLGIHGVANDGELGGMELYPSPLFPMYRFQDHPFTNYRLVESQEFPPLHYEPYGRYRYFWELCGPYLTSLDLQNNSCFYKSSFIDGLIWLLKSCPTIEELSFSPVWEPEGDTDDEDSDEDELDARPLMFPIILLPISENSVAKMREIIAPQMKSLCIKLNDFTLKNKLQDYSIVHDDNRLNQSRFFNFFRCVFSLMPNLKTLSMNRLYYVVMEALNQETYSTGKIIQLENFVFSGESLYHSMYQFRWGALLKYLEKLETEGGFLKTLTLKKIALLSFWGKPRSFRNVVFRIRKRIEKFHLGFWNHFLPVLPAHCTFDLFNFNFPNLAELTLEISYEPTFGTDINRNCTLFSFSLFRGTPNLTHFRMKYLHISDKDWLKTKLATRYLKKGGPGEKWYLVEDVRANEQAEDIEILQGDEDDTFDPAVGNGSRWEDEILLEKMKKFYFTGRFTTKAILVFGKWMKNLKEFAIIFDDETIFIPFVVWPGTLKKLTVLKNLHWMEKEKSVTGPFPN